MRWIKLLLLIFLIFGGQVFGQTYVGGPIDKDTTWTPEHSPYIVTEDLIVKEGVTLTIKPGVTVSVNPHTDIIIKGTLIAIGTSEENRDIKFLGGKIIFEGLASGGIIKYCTIELGSEIEIDHSSPSIIGNEIKHYGVGLWLKYSSSLIKDNIIEGYEGGCGQGMWIEASPCTLIGNTISNHYECRWDGGIDVGYSPPPKKIHFNNFYNNLQNIYYCIKEGDTLDARYNWWGTCDEEKIKRLFYDWGCGGMLLYKPWLESPYTAVEKTTWGEIKARYR